MAVLRFPIQPMLLWLLLSVCLLKPIKQPSRRIHFEHRVRHPGEKEVLSFQESYQEFLSDKSHTYHSLLPKEYQVFITAKRRKAYFDRDYALQSFDVNGDKVEYILPIVEAGNYEMWSNIVLQNEEGDVTIDYTMAERVFYVASNFSLISDVEFPELPEVIEHPKWIVKFKFLLEPFESATFFLCLYNITKNIPVYSFKARNPGKGLFSRTMFYSELALQPLNSNYKWIAYRLILDSDVEKVMPVGSSLVFRIRSKDFQDDDSVIIPNLFMFSSYRNLQGKNVLSPRYEESINEGIYARYKFPKPSPIKYEFHFNCDPDQVVEQSFLTLRQGTIYINSRDYEPGPYCVYMEQENVFAYSETFRVSRNHIKFKGDGLRRRTPIVLVMERPYQVFRLSMEVYVTDVYLSNSDSLIHDELVSSLDIPIKKNIEGDPFVNSLPTEIPLVLEYGGRYHPGARFYMKFFIYTIEYGEIGFFATARTFSASTEARSTEHLYDQELGKYLNIPFMNKHVNPQDGSPLHLEQPYSFSDFNFDILAPEPLPLPE